MRLDTGLKVGGRGRVGAAFALACVVAGLGSQSALADPPYSWFDPPPLCSEQPGHCVAQPSSATEGNLASPIQIDMPTMRVILNEDVAPGVPPDTTGTVTFTITDYGAPLSGYSWSSPLRWPNGMTLHAVPDKSSDPDDSFETREQSFVTDGNLAACEGKRSCTFITEDFPEGGWYIAGANLPGGKAGVVGRGVCSSTGCLQGASFSAVYVPQPGEDLDPPYVEVATTGSGVTTKAIAQAQDPGDQAMSLLWDFGDGATQAGALGQVVSHTYSAPGDFDVTAIVTATDGRMDSVSESAKVQPPRPILQAVARNGSATTGVAAGTVQGWAEGTKAMARYWTDGCPSHPDIEYPFSDGFSIDAIATAEDTVSMDFNFLDPAANAFVLEAEAEIPAGQHGSTVLTHRVSDCVEMTPGPVHETTAATEIGATEVPVDSASVPVGNVAVIDAGADDAKQDLAEQREVTGHGSLLVSALDRAHPFEAKVIDAGLPLEPYVLPGPPDDPTLEPFDPQCSDGIDNDGDGKIDHPDDPGCTDPDDDAEIDPAPDPGPSPGPTPGSSSGASSGSTPGPSPGPSLGPTLSLTPGVEPSNAYSVQGTKASSRRGVMTLSVEVPGPGTLITSQARGGVSASASRGKGKRGGAGKQCKSANKRKKRKSCKKRSKALLHTTRKRVRGAGRVAVKARLSKLGKRRLAKRGRLPVRVRVIFKPHGGQPISRTKRVVFRKTQGKHGRGEKGGKRR